MLHAHAELVAAAGGGEEAALLLTRALEEGYLRALRLSRGDTDAQCGVAEVKLALARRAGAVGDGATAARLAAESADAYAAALAKPQLLGCVSDRAEVQYNFACAAANCGAWGMCDRWHLCASLTRCASLVRVAGRLEEATAALRQLVACGLTQEAEVLADADLAPLRASLG